MLVWHRDELDAAARHLESGIRLAEEADAEYELALSLIASGRLSRASTGVNRGREILARMGAEASFLLPTPSSSQSSA